MGKQLGLLDPRVRAFLLDHGDPRQAAKRRTECQMHARASLPGREGHADPAREPLAAVGRSAAHELLDHVAGWGLEAGGWGLGTGDWGLETGDLPPKRRRDSLSRLPSPFSPLLEENCQPAQADIAPPRPDFFGTENDPQGDHRAGRRVDHAQRGPPAEHAGADRRMRPASPGAKVGLARRGEAPRQARPGGEGPDHRGGDHHAGPIQRLPQGAGQQAIPDRRRAECQRAGNGAAGALRQQVRGPGVGVRHAATHAVPQCSRGRCALNLHFAFFNLHFAFLDGPAQAVAAR